jgi:hypothetical protein
VSRTRLTGPLLWASVLFLAALKLWLVDDLPFTAIPAVVDDGMYLGLGVSLAEGRWLGPYDQYTLAKPPFYSFFIAASRILGLPLRLAQEMLYAAFVVVTLVAVRPLLARPGARLALAALLLFNPATFCAPVTGRVIREGVYPALAGLVLASAVGLYLRRHEGGRALATWSALLGASLAAFWTTREEGEAMLPALALLLGATALAQRRLPGRAARLLACTGPLALWPLGVLAVAAGNARHYGWFTLAEPGSPAFSSAIAGLERIVAGPRQPHASVTRRARRLAYGASPALARLEPRLEGPLAAAYAENTALLSAEARGEVGTGWLLWALRDAAAAEGLHRSAREARAFYAAAGRELADACLAGRLRCRPAWTTALGPRVRPLRASEWAPLGAGLARAVALTVSFRGLDAPSRPSLAGPEERARWSALLGSAVVPGPGEPTPPPSRRARLRGAVAAAYRLLPIVAAAALAGALRMAWAARRAGHRDLAVVTAGVLLALVGRALVVGYLEVTQFRATIPLYLAAAYPVTLLWCGLGALGLARAAPVDAVTVGAAER